jgi:hypothetical protein
MEKENNKNIYVKLSSIQRGRFSHHHQHNNRGVTFIVKITALYATYSDYLNKLHKRHSTVKFRK